MAKPNGDNQDKSIENAVQQFVHTQSHGQEPDIDEFVKQYPELENQLRQRLLNLNKIDDLFDSLVQADEDDFEGTAISDNLVGQKLRDFEIIKVIGRGGMGVVYLAHDTRLKRSVAVKSIPAALADDSTARMRFKREAELLASLNHPNIAVIHDIIEQKEDTGYLVLEYVPGQTLAQRIAHKPLKLQEALSIGRQIAEAVAAAHEKSIVHRDLKPGNIKLTPEGRVKVLDFGLAKPAGDQDKSKDSVVTQAGSIIGTPAYMSPEQIRGGSTDSRTDIWSFGCIMYEMLTGKRPFEGKTVSDTIAHTLELQPDWDALPSNTPTKIRTLLKRCLDKNPDQRLGDITNAATEISETLNKPALAPILSVMQRKIAMIIGAVIIIVLSCFAIRFILNNQGVPSSKEIRLAVLPFENLGPFEEEYFASGVTDAITARLAGLHGLAVISRQSAFQYKNSDKRAQEIGKALGVDYILEGTIQRERPSDPNSTIRIIPQLIRTNDDTHVWSNIFDNDMSKIFQVQSDVAEQIAQALDITLLEPERQTLAYTPTGNTQAYEYYLRGKEYIYRGYSTENNLRTAIQMYEKAIELDPEFALAYAELSRAHVRMYWHRHDHSDERLTMAERALNKALELNPDHPEVRFAFGHYYFHGHMDYNSALEQFEIALKSQPNNSELMHLIGSVQRRQGKFELALYNKQNRACELDPLSSPFAESTGETFMLLRRYTEAERYLKRAISLAPDELSPYVWNSWIYILREGRTDKAWAVLDQAQGKVPAQAFESNLPGLKFILYHVFDGNYQGALDSLSSYSLEAINSQFLFVPKAQLYAQIYGLMGNQQLEKEYYESARNILEAKIREQMDDARFHSSLGIAYAGLDRKEEAIREGKLGVQLLPISRDAWRGLYREKDLAQIYVMVDEYDLAIEKLEYLLSIPGEMSIPLLKLDPAWEPLREYPHFKELVEQDKNKK